MTVYYAAEIDSTKHPCECSEVEQVRRYLPHSKGEGRAKSMSEKASYQLVLLGDAASRSPVLMRLIYERLEELGLPRDAIRLLTEAEASARTKKVPTIPIFFGYSGASDNDHPEISSFIEDSNYFISIVSNLTNVSQEIPASLRHINAIEVKPHNGNFDRVASLVLEGFRLLRRERRLFISYKRTDSQALANQLYDALDARGFDVFIDTRTVPPAVDFQAELWHRLSDSDVVVLIDTEDFRSSRWTTEELARANATNIQILHILWPGQPEDSASSFSHFHNLSEGDFVDWVAPVQSRQLRSEAVDVVCQMAEKLRARAIAARHRYLVDNFCDAARDEGMEPTVQPQRWISIKLKGDEELAIVPTIGTPTSERINQVFDAIADAGSGGAGTWILYDNRGMLSSWMKHLEWLDVYLPAKSIKVAFASDALKRLKND